MEFGRAFSYITEDQEWAKKLLIAGLIFLIPILGSIIVLGWMMEIVRRVIAGEPNPLPGWENFSDYITKGFQAFVVSLAYTLPIIIISTCFQLVVPFMAEVGSGGGDSGDAIAAVLMVVSLCLSCFMFIYSIFINLALPAAYGNLVATGELAAAFRFNEVYGLVRAAVGPYLLVIVGGVAAGLIAMLGFLACFIGLIFTYPFAMAVMGHLYGQAYNAAKAAQALQA